MIKYVYTAILLAFMGQSYAGDLSLQIHGLSHHLSKRTNGEGKWHETNLGAGLRYNFNKEWSGQVGFYQNSDSRPNRTLYSIYGIAQYTPWGINEFKVGGFGGIATGYAARPQGAFIGGLMVTNDRLTVRFAPKANKHGSAVISLEIGIPF